MTAMHQIRFSDLPMKVLPPLSAFCSFVFIYLMSLFLAPVSIEKALKHHRLLRLVGFRYTNCNTLKCGLCIHQEIATSCTVFQVCAP